MLRRRFRPKMETPTRKIHFTFYAPDINLWPSSKNVVDSLHFISRTTYDSTRPWSHFIIYCILFHKYFPFDQTITNIHRSRSMMKTKHKIRILHCDGLSSLLKRKIRPSFLFVGLHFTSKNFQVRQNIIKIGVGANIFQVLIPSSHAFQPMECIVNFTYKIVSKC